ncbi:HprK-related kinase A [Catenovulum sp. 2E275]|uniref:HprK-related kinase A n=1 Tax=Catenovulum sp. 2E275 TaxID=2980497 RepID=UPI0021CE0560|nr:HprK-related kinase A [Catenovulum sp. 2E275]MCU4675572.1 HprK-related kinase A [Catenovulum sp. 2E275]
MFSRTFALGPFNFKINSQIIKVKTELERLYKDFVPVADADFIDFDINITQPPNIRRWLRPQVDFIVDEFKPFKPLPLNHAYPMLEWGMNWCIASNAHHFFIMHAAAIEKNNKVIVLPAQSGAGKSTLSAALSYNGWRLFSDELALFSLKNKLLYPLARPINLKNDSIDIIRNYIPNAVFSEVVHDTHKGTVALLKPPLDSVKQVNIENPLACFVFPKYVENSPVRLKACSVEQAFSSIIEQSFNYHILGKEAFELVSYYLRNVKAYTLEYSDFIQANDALSELV